MSISFKVIDLNCEATDASFFQPQIEMRPTSTTTIATVYGYAEFVASTPPKRYHSIAFSGVSRRVGVTAENTPRQCAGAKYVYGGTGTIDAHGVQTSKYKKDFFAQCSKAFWPLEPNQNNPNAIKTGTDPAFFVGYCWPDDTRSCSVCDPDEADWAFLGNVATNTPGVDLAAFVHTSGAPVVSATSWSINDSFSGLTSLDTYAPDLANPPPTNLNGFPQEFLDGVLGAYINWTDTNIYSATLSSESTDAEAVANAKVIVGTGATTQYAIRTTGLPALVGKVTTTTTVVYSLLMSRLIDGQDYVVTVDLWEQDSASSFNSHTLKSYSFTASGTTHSIMDAVPSPSLNHTITVQKPKISFAT